ncbi:MAG: hypothetical protein ACYCOR_03295 [Acidobacteriaceae bacterium]
MIRSCFRIADANLLPELWGENLNSEGYSKRSVAVSALDSATQDAVAKIAALIGFAQGSLQLEVSIQFENVWES